MAGTKQKADIELVANKGKEAAKDALDVAENSLESAKETASEAVDSVKDAAEDSLEVAKETAGKAADAAKDFGHNAAEKASSFAKGAAEKSKTMFADVPSTLKDILSSIKGFITPIHGAGWPFIAGFLLASFVLSQISETLGWIGLFASAWCVYFFRNPARVVPQDENLVVSPADGRVQMIRDVVPPKELGLGEDECTRVSIFLNVFDVHVNRVPASGKIIAAHYHEGAFFNASLDKASEENERQLVAMETTKGHKIGFVQIAGLIARRIICNIEEGQEVEAGSEYGLIRFGSRVDVFLPKGTASQVIVGQRCVGGETVIADFSSKAKKSRVGVTR